MKNLKMFAITLLGMLVMVSGVHAADNFGYAANCTESTATGNKCTLTTTASLSGTVTIDRDLTIVTTATKNVSIGNGVKLIIAEGRKVTITGDNSNLVYLSGSGEIEIEDNASLIVTGGKEGSNAGIYITGYASSNAPKITVNDGGTLSVSNNVKGFVGDKSNASYPDAEIILHRATLKVNNNKQNGMNGSVKITADYSEIEGNGNGHGGLNATFDLDHESHVTATGNGLSGVTLANGSKIAKGCTITATDNLGYKGTDARINKYLADRSDVSVVGTSTIEGTITADSIGREKVTWTSRTATEGTVNPGALALVDNAKVDVKTVKSLCDTSAATDGYTITCDADHAETLGVSGVGVVIEGTTATTYGAAKVNLPATVTKVVIDDENAQVTVAEGTQVENKTEGTLRVFTSDGKYVEVEAGKTAQIGEAVNPGDQTNPGDQNAGDANTPADGTTGRLPDEPAKTNDNILVYAGLGLVSALAVSFSTKRKENN